MMGVEDFVQESYIQVLRNFNRKETEKQNRDFHYNMISIILDSLYLQFSYKIIRKESEGTVSIEDSSGKAIFGGEHSDIFDIFPISNTHYIVAQPIHSDNPLVYCKDGKSFDTLPEAVLNPVKDLCVGFGLWERLYNSCSLVYNMIDGIDILDRILSYPNISDQNNFLEVIYSDINNRIEEHKGDPIKQRNSLVQFIQGLEHLAAHPDEALGYAKGGLG